MCECNKNMVLGGGGVGMGAIHTISGIPRIGLKGLGDVPDTGSNIDLGYGNPTDYSMPTESPYPVVMDGISYNGGSGIDWNSILQQWTGAGIAIAKAAGGANPTYASVGPGGSTVVYGSGAGTPLLNTLPTLGTSFGSLLPIGLGLVAIVVLVKAFK